MIKSAKEFYNLDDHCKGMGEIFGRFPVIAFLILLIFVFLMTGACKSPRIRVGNRPDTDALENSLRLGESTRAAVMEALGKPYGEGKTMLPIDPSPRTMWSYYYEEGDFNDCGRRIFLFVFFDGDHYDGYMWFSSLPK